MKARATDNDLIWENFNQSTPVKPEELAPAQSAEPVPELPDVKKILKRILAYISISSEKLLSRILISNAPLRAILSFSRVLYPLRG